MGTSATAFLRRWFWQAAVLEAGVWLTLAVVLIRLLPFRWLIHLMGRPQDIASDPEAPANPPVKTRELQARRIGAAVLRASGLVPFKALCLPRALAARTMLALRGLKTTIHFGSNMTAEGRFTAHAWLTFGEFPVIGARSGREFKEIARFK